VFLYINLPINRKTFHSKEKNKGIQQHCQVITSGESLIKKIKDNLWQYYPKTIVESINWLPYTGLFKLINYFNNRRLAAELKKAFRELNF